MENGAMWGRKVIKGKLEIPDPKENRQEVIFNTFLSLCTLTGCNLH